MHLHQTSIHRHNYYSGFHMWVSDVKLSSVSSCTAVTSRMQQSHESVFLKRRFCSVFGLCSPVKHLASLNQSHPIKLLLHISCFLFEPIDFYNHGDSVSHKTVWNQGSCHEAVTDVGGNACGMLVCDGMNPWQQNNECKQHADKQRRSAPVRPCLCACYVYMCHALMYTLACGRLWLENDYHFISHKSSTTSHYRTNEQSRMHIGYHLLFIISLFIKVSCSYDLIFEQYPKLQL